MKGLYLVELEPLQVHESEAALIELGTDPERFDEMIYENISQ